MAGEVSEAFQDCLNAVAVVLLKGAKWFAEDLLGQVKGKFDVEYLTVSSYRGDKSTGEVKIEGEIKQSLSGKEVLLIDDIYDTGETLKTAVEYLKGYSPKRVRTCVFLEKEVEHEEEVEIDYLGYKVPDVFLVGYGLDYEEKYRELAYICSLEAAQTNEVLGRVMLR